MAEAGCTGPTCKFVGGKMNSPAAVGVCTVEAGFIANAEIDAIISNKEEMNAETWFDISSNSDILVYHGTEWVAYMTQMTKDSRRALWQGMNFAGTIDWAVDLQSFNEDEQTGPNGTIPEEDWPPLEPCDDYFDSLEELEAAIATVPSHCVNLEVIRILQKIHTDAISTYNELMVDGYDKKFNTYAKAVSRSGESAVQTFMHDRGNEFFTCDVTEPVYCCKWCHYVYDDDPVGKCRYCEEFDCDWDPSCGGIHNPCPEMEIHWRNITGPCSPDFSLRAGPEPTDGYTNAVYWYMKPEQEDAFWAQLYANTGIDQASVHFDDWHHLASCEGDHDCEHHYWDYNFPLPDGFDPEDVLNPKDLVQQAYDRFAAVGGDIEMAVDMVRLQMFEGDGDDLADAFSLPVFMLQTAVSQMTEIADTVEEWNEEKRKATILGWLTAIFFFVPIAGEVVGSVAALANVGRVIATLGAMGDIAMSIYDVVDADEDNLPLAIIGLVLAPLSIFDVAQVGEAARLRRGMTPDTTKKLGSRISDPLDAVVRIKKASVCSSSSPARRWLAVGNQTVDALTNANESSSVSTSDDTETEFLTLRAVGCENVWGD